MVDVYIPEKRSAMSKLFGGLQTVGQGAGDYSTIMGAFGGGDAGGGGVGAGGAATGAGMSLGAGNVTPVTTGMSPILGGGAPAGGATAAGSGGATAAGSGGGTAAAMGSSIMGPAAAVGAGYYANYQMGKAMDEKRDTANDRAKAAYKENPNRLNVEFSDEYQPMGQAPAGLQLTGSKSDGLGAMERRISNQQTAMQDIQAAQEQLNVAGLPTDERRRIGQKLELARQQIGGQNRGNKRLYT